MKIFNKRFDPNKFFATLLVYTIMTAVIGTLVFVATRFPNWVWISIVSGWAIMHGYKNATKKQK